MKSMKWQRHVSLMLLLSAVGCKAIESPDMDFASQRESKSRVRSTTLRNRSAEAATTESLVRTPPPPRTDSLPSNSAYAYSSQQGNTAPLFSHSRSSVATLGAPVITPTQYPVNDSSFAQQTDSLVQQYPSQPNGEFVRTPQFPEAENQSSSVQQVGYSTPVYGVAVQSPAIQSAAAPSLSSNLNPSLRRGWQDPAIPVPPSGNQTETSVAGGERVSGGESQLDLGSLEQAAIQNNPQLLKLSAEIQAANGRYLQAGFYPNPLLGFSGQQIGSGGQAEQYGVLLQQDVITGGKIGIDQQVEACEAASRREAYAAEEKRTVRDVRLALAELVVVHEKLNRNRETEANLKELLDKVDRQVKALEASQFERMRVARFVQGLEAEGRGLEAELAGKWQKLENLTQISDLRSKMVPSLTDLSPVLNRDADAIMAELMSHPELRALENQVSKSSWVVQRAVAETVPNVTVQSVWQYDESLDSSNANLQVTLPVPFRHRNEGNIQAARGDYMASQSARDQRERELTIRLRELFSQHASAQARLEMLAGEQGLVASLTRELKLAQDAFQGGEATIFDIVQTTVSLGEAKNNLADAWLEAYQASTQLDLLAPLQ